MWWCGLHFNPADVSARAVITPARQPLNFLKVFLFFRFSISFVAKNMGVRSHILFFKEFLFSRAM